MSIEIEATFLEVDHDALRQKLASLGAQLVSVERLMRRTMFDYPDLRLDNRAAWIRVRDEGDQVTISYKQRHAETVDGMQEIELQVQSYEAACDFFKAIDLSVKSIQETKREKWRYKKCDVTLDTWPHIPPYIEIEAESQNVVQSVSEELGFNWNEAIFDSADAVYQRYFDVTRTEISTIPLLFGEVPTVLENKRRPLTTQA